MIYAPYVFICMGKIIDYINQELSLRDEYARIFGRQLPTGKFLCPNPMHQHTNNTPSCKVYGNAFKCFGQCNRVFGVYDLLKWYDPKRIEEVKSSIVITETQQPQRVVLARVQVDKSLPIHVILQQITGIVL